MGPGLLYAGAAIGVSHLVQSTRAGADFGFSLIWVIIIANLIKYPFFEFAPRYTAATGNNLIKGYNKIGKWAIVMYFVLTIGSMFAIQAAITSVTAGILINVFNLKISIIQISTLILIATMAVIIIGQYKVLDKLIKYVIITLTVATLIAVIFAIDAYNPAENVEKVSFTFNNPLHLAFFIAFIGWMPAPLDITVWQSIWNEEKAKSLGRKISLKDSLLDFNIGYFGTAIIAVLFLSLGALIMYGSGEELSNKGVLFSEQLIHLYTSTLGSWAYPIIAIAALLTMISTTITVFDAYWRSLVPTSKLLFGRYIKKNLFEKHASYIWMAILLLGTVLSLKYLAKSMTDMVDFATIMSFVLAPFLAILNLKLVTHKHVPDFAKPNLFLRILAYFGIAFLIGFSLYYAYFSFVGLGVG